MDIIITTLALAAAMAFIMEYIDSSLGMGYGTVLSPIFIIMGFSPLLVVPSILISQAAGGFTASLFHHKFRNVEFKLRSNDSKIVYIITLSGMLATVAATFIAIQIPKVYLNAYIGLLVAVMGVILVWNVTFRFTWKKMIGLGMISAFNKGMSGGGFGPVVTGGQIIAGQNHKNAIGCTTMAEAPICITAFIVFLLASGIANWWLPLALIIGAAAAAPMGAFTTSRLNSPMFRVFMGALIAFLGLWMLWKMLL